MLRTQIVTPNIPGMKKLAEAAGVAAVLKAAIIAGRVRVGPAVIVDRAAMDRVGRVREVPVVAVDRVPGVVALADPVRMVAVRKAAEIFEVETGVEVPAVDLAGAKMIVRRRRRCRRLRFRSSPRKRASNPSRAKSN
jgi:hypothetical protein